MKGETVLKELLATNYGIQVNEKTVWNGMEGFAHDNYFYFTISVDHTEIIHMEQAALAYYLYENKFTQIAIPIPNSEGEWYSKFLNKYYMVFQVEKNISDKGLAHGEELARFHQVGSQYKYEPQSISSYGQWKLLWIEKLNAFEKQIEVDSKDFPNTYYRLLMDVLPYLIGVSENAIQYMQESENESRFHESDQGSISFRRYRGDLKKSVIWTTNLVYDHPTRDLAEYIRSKLLEQEDPKNVIWDFLNEYQGVRRLSIFSWRLLYARLIYPVNLFDIIQRGFSEQSFENRYIELSDMLERQTIYEKRLGTFFENLEIDSESLEIPVLNWL